MESLPSARRELAESWIGNARAWTESLREHRIESRRLVTDKAIVQALLDRRPNRVLDLGCGEGWLCRRLADEGIESLGIDASGPLVEAARDADCGGRYLCLPFEDLAERAAGLGRFDTIVFNFALLQKDLGPVLRPLHEMLQRSGSLLIQTVHPWVGAADRPYGDGWRVENFDDFGEGFEHAMPWYFRTLNSWSVVLNQSGWWISSLGEPSHPQSGLPLSLMIDALPRAIDAKRLF